jgi:hypothetical protein
MIPLDERFLVDFLVAFLLAFFAVVFLEAAFFVDFFAADFRLAAFFVPRAAEARFFVAPERFAAFLPLFFPDFFVAIISPPHLICRSAWTRPANVY